VQVVKAGGVDQKQPPNTGSGLWWSVGRETGRFACGMRPASCRSPPRITDISPSAAVLIVLAAVALPALIVAGATAATENLGDLTDLDCVTSAVQYVAVCAVRGRGRAEKRISAVVLGSRDC